MSQYAELVKALRETATFTKFDDLLSKREQKLESLAFDAAAAIEALQADNDILHQHIEDLNEAFRSESLARQKAEAAQPHWVSVEDELPDDDYIVLLCNDVMFVHCAFYNSLNRKWYIANNTDYDSWTWEPDAMYWMPLPEPPQEVQE